VDAAGVGVAGTSAGSAGAAGSAGSAGAAGTAAASGAGALAGYTLVAVTEFDGGPDARAKLVDMDGIIVHEWPITGFPPKMLPGGSLMGCKGVVPGSYDCVDMQQVSWDGTLEWSFANWIDTGGGAMASRQHHDMQREGNPVGYYAPGHTFVDQGNTLVLAHVTVLDTPLRAEGLDDDVIYEVDWAGNFTGFEWHTIDHVDDFGFDQAALDDIRTRSPGYKLEWMHGNSISRLGPNHWFDEGHAEFHPDNIMYSARAANLVLIIAHDTGEVVWRIGPDFTGRPEESLGQFVGQHLPHIIPEGLPGAGNVLVFDNGGLAGYGGTNSMGEPNRFTRDYSRVIEFNPITFEIVWQYGSESGDDMLYSIFLSSAQRLPNGNTLVALGNAARVIEITPDKEIVWEYDFIPDSSGVQASWLYRAYRVPPDWLPPGVNEQLGNYESWTDQFE
jgi:hypothetical protein